MTPDHVIVTVQLDVGKPLGDYELPADLPARQLAAVLLDALKQKHPQLFTAWNAMHLISQGQSLADEDTLASRGIWDGGFLTVAPG